jgi:hypothetical protein
MPFLPSVTAVPNPDPFQIAGFLAESAGNPALMAAA